MTTDLTLSELADLSGVQARTLRSWIAQDLIPGPLNRGPNARYPEDTLHRVRAVRAMKEVLGMPVPAIRQELLVITPARLAEYAKRGERLMPEPSGAMSPPAPADPDAAFDYFSRLRRESHSVRESAPHGPVTGFEALERRLALGSKGKGQPGKVMSETRSVYRITADVELSVRGQLDSEEHQRLERCADLIRDILIGGES